MIDELIQWNEGGENDRCEVVYLMEQLGKIKEYCLHYCNDIITDTN